MKVYGLTGGIGSGKSTVASMLKALGAEVIDADQVARDVVRAGSEGLAKLVAAFGADIVDEHGALDRKKLGARVFADPVLRERLNAITHPLIAAETAARMQALAARGVELVFYEAALLVENGAHRGFSGLIVVESDVSARRTRVRTRDGLGDSAFDDRVRAQTSDEARRAVADVVVHNDGTLESLKAQVEVLWQGLRGDRPLR